MTKFLCGECIHNSDKGGGCLIPKNLGYVDNCNRYLPKDKPIVQTNEEWLRGCTTMELAEWIVGMSTICTINHECDRCDSWCDEKRVVEWLKQPHTP